MNWSAVLVELWREKIFFNPNSVTPALINMIRYSTPDRMRKNVMLCEFLEDEVSFRITLNNWMGNKPKQVHSRGS